MLINASLPGIAKVGATAVSPDAYAAQLSQERPAPSPFIVAYTTDCLDCVGAQSHIHGALDEGGFRAQEGPGFFSAPLDYVIKLIAAYTQEAQKHVQQRASADDLVGEQPPWHLKLTQAKELLEKDKRAKAKPAADLLREAIQLGSGEACGILAGMYLTGGAFPNDEAKATALLKQGAAYGHAECYSTLASWAHLGAGKVNKNIREAIRLYEEAAKLGSWEACRSLCEIYRDAYGDGCEDPGKAMYWAKAGVKAGGDECYVNMAELFAAKHEYSDARKCFLQFFRTPTFTGGEDLYSFLTERHQLKP